MSVVSPQQDFVAIIDDIQSIARERNVRADYTYDDARMKECLARLRDGGREAGNTILQVLSRTPDKAAYMENILVDIEDMEFNKDLFAAFCASRHPSLDALLVDVLTRRREKDGGESLSDGDVQTVVSKMKNASFLESYCRFVTAYSIPPDKWARIPIDRYSAAVRHLVLLEDRQAALHNRQLVAISLACMKYVGPFGMEYLKVIPNLRDNDVQNWVTLAMAGAGRNDLLNEVAAIAMSPEHEVFLREMALTTYANACGEAALPLLEKFKDDVTESPFKDFPGDPHPYYSLRVRARDLSVRIKQETQPCCIFREE